MDEAPGHSAPGGNNPPSVAPREGNAQQLDLAPQDNGYYIENLERSQVMIDDTCTCTCSTDSFDVDDMTPVLQTLDEKLRKLPPCMKTQAYSDILLYIRYLKRKHRKMLLRSADKRIPGV